MHSLYQRCSLKMIIFAWSTNTFLPTYCVVSLHIWRNYAGEGPYLHWGSHSLPLIWLVGCCSPVLQGQSIWWIGSMPLLAFPSIFREVERRTLLLSWILEARISSCLLGYLSLSFTLLLCPRGLMYEGHSFDSAVSSHKNYQASIFQSKVGPKPLLRIYKPVIHSIQQRWWC